MNRPVEKAISRYYIRDAAGMLKEMPQMIVIGVTGSYGKTSVKFYLQKLLAAKYNVLITFNVMYSLHFVNTRIHIELCFKANFQFSFF